MFRKCFRFVPILISLSLLFIGFTIQTDPIPSVHAQDTAEPTLFLNIEQLPQVQLMSGLRGKLVASEGGRLYTIDLNSGVVTRLSGPPPC
jgi:hypothetical protein